MSAMPLFHVNKFSMASFTWRSVSRRTSRLSEDIDSILFNLILEERTHACVLTD